MRLLGKRRVSSANFWNLALQLADTRTGKELSGENVEYVSIYGSRYEASDDCVLNIAKRGRGEIQSEQIGACLAARDPVDALVVGAACSRPVAVSGTLENGTFFGVQEPVVQASTNPSGIPVEQEHKFVLKRDEAERLMELLGPRLTLEVYDQQRPVAYTRTTYLDTDSLEYFGSCGGGGIMRRLRIREYAASADHQTAPVLTGICALELKESAGAIRCKARISAPPELVAKIVASYGEVPEATQDLVQQMQPWKVIRSRLCAGRPSPRLTTWYRRVSMVGDRLRVTMDEGIAFCAPVTVGMTGAVAEPEGVIRRRSGRVVEVKHQGEPPDWLAQALSGLQESQGFSKFAEGMRAMTASLPTEQGHDASRPIALPADLWRTRNQ